jgi:hypothetical protein
LSTCAIKKYSDSRPARLADILARRPLHAC